VPKKPVVWIAIRRTVISDTAAPISKGSCAKKAVSADPSLQCTRRLVVFDTSI